MSVSLFFYLRLLDATLNSTSHQTITDTAQLTKFGLNATIARDQNSISEKWEGLALLPALEPNAPNDYLLLVGNDNDFKAANVFHNGIIVGTNNPTVDNMVLAYRLTLPISRQTATRKRDFDGDGRSDLSVYRSGTWFVQNSGNQAATIQQFGLVNDRLAGADYDGDDKADFAVFRDGLWYILGSQTNSVRVLQFGLANDIPVSADYDNDGKADLAVFRPSNGTWYFLNSFNGNFRATQFGQIGDVPVSGDYNGDSVTDIAYWRPATGVWNIRYTSAADGLPSLQPTPTAFGLPTDIPVQGDYNGDGRTDIAVYRPSEGNWYFLLGTNNFTVQRFGATGDVPVTGDYDGDGRNDLAVFRAGNWHILNSSNAVYRVQQWGVAADLPIQ